MAIPVGAKLFAESMDPYDIVDFEIDMGGMLESGEAIATASLALPPESVLLGLKINNTGGYTTSLAGNKIRFWLSIAEEDQDKPAFAATGVRLPIELSLVTTSIPPRRRQRTVVVEVLQR